MKENGYNIKNKDFSNYFQIIKDRRTFEMGFNSNSTTVMLFISFHRPTYFLPLSLGGISIFILSGILAGISDLFIGILLGSGVLLLIFLMYYGKFIAKYDSKREMASPENIDELMHLAEKSREKLNFF